MNRLPDGRRNVLLIVADQLRADALACYGRGQMHTPWLDGLAASGTRFTQHYSASAPCGPARASLLTGLPQSRHVVRNNRTPALREFPTIATSLTAGGMDCHVVGYTDTVGADDGLETVPPGFSWHTRFNLNELGLKEWYDALAEQGHPVPDRPEDLLQPVPGTNNLASYPAHLSDTAFVADRTIDCMRENDDRPWLIVATFLRPHPPWLAPAPYHRRHDPLRMSAPRRSATVAAEAARHPFLGYWLSRRSADTDPARLGAAAVARQQATYLGLVAELDAQVGRVLTALCELGRDRDTLVVFTSDHGETLGDHWSLGTGGFRSTAYHVPLIVRDPTALGATVIDSPTGSVDVPATVLSWAGTDPLPATDGRSLLPGAAEPRTDVRYEFDFHAQDGGRAERELGLRPEECRLSVLRAARYTYVEFPALAPMLYDHHADPGELTDLAAHPEHRQTLSAHARLLQAR